MDLIKLESPQRTIISAAEEAVLKIHVIRDVLWRSEDDDCPSSVPAYSKKEINECFPSCVAGAVLVEMHDHYRAV
jgi:hypothetical protein